MKPQQYESKIRKYNKSQLIKLWTGILKKDTPDWEQGMALQYLVVRSFELEGAEVTYPFSVNKPVNITTKKRIVEQLDGVVYIPKYGLSIIIESKDKRKNSNIEPVAKLTLQLNKRPSSTIGAIFSSKSFTDSTIYQVTTLHHPTVLLWEKNDIDYCLKKKGFIIGMITKYKHAVEHGIRVLDLKTYFEKK